MDNPETEATLDTLFRTKKTIEKMSNADIIKNPGMNTGAVEG